ncbi:MAG TPA: PhnD/SsuA/transferrin family substrate-binding protein [Kiloniellales bacterium]
MSVASLPMYDLPEVAAATDAWWAGIARALRREGIEDVPDGLRRDRDLTRPWRAPDLLFSQTCGYPLTHEFAGKLCVVSTPCFDCAGCEGPRYRSLLIVREDDPAIGLGDLRGRIAAVNAPHSQSGYSALRASVAPLARSGRFFSEIVMSGGHADSLALVAGGKADLCAVDCVTHALLARYRPAAVANLRALGATVDAPGLPYVTRADASDERLRRLRAGLFAALADPSVAAAREALLIAGAEVLPAAAYDRIVDIEDESRARGYARLA